ncbi:MAG: endonuclease [Salinivirgaceae bacterium]|nr:endonuclease [Salinivirgaceae bacterium]
MKNILLLPMLLISMSLMAQPAKWNKKKHFTIMSYNVENLFDTVAFNHSDDEFTPGSPKQWGTERYTRKLENIAKVIASVHPEELPELVGMVELENIQVLSDLVKTPALQKANYVPLLIEGPDPRGIDCGLIYRPDAFKYLSHKAIPVFFNGDSSRRTRDILYVKGLVKKDTLHVFVNHWTSRRGGEDTEIKRVQCAQALKKQVDSLLAINLKSLVVIMGDFNDEPSDKSLHETLQASNLEESGILENLMYPLHTEGKGTYYFKGAYNMLDNMVISRAIKTKAKGFRLLHPSGMIFNPEMISYTQKNGDKAPNRTFSGDKYFGGFSDHFPIYTIFYEK